ncbi:MAG: helix-turn-helix domain-containing protein [Candidatus Nanopelagicales bacterium]
MAKSLSRLEGDTLVLSDPRAIRALAHPARLCAVDELFRGDIELSATDLSAIANVTPSTMSYHLRALESFGMVERAGGSSDGRERRWRGVARRLKLDVNSASTTMVEFTIVDEILSRLRERWSEWAASSKPSEWEDATTLSRTRLRLTADQAVELQEKLNQVVEEFRAVGGSGDGAAGSAEVGVVYSVLPDLGKSATS